jgi:hypothetical protein
LADRSALPQRVLVQQNLEWILCGTVSSKDGLTAVNRFGSTSFTGSSYLLWPVIIRSPSLLILSRYISASGENKAWFSSYTFRKEETLSCFEEMTTIAAILSTQKSIFLYHNELAELRIRWLMYRSIGEFTPHTNMPF